MVNNEFAKDIAKAVAKTDIKSELDAGATPRRYEPVGGVQKLNERIHKESAQMDKHGNLPFTFSKPSKGGKRTTVKVCNNCGYHVTVNENCVGMICCKCRKFASVVEISNEEVNVGGEKG